MNAVLLVVVGFVLFLLLTRGSSTEEYNGLSPIGGSPPLEYTSALPVQRDELLSVVAMYRLKDGSGDYRFRVQETVPGSFRVYILQQPRRGAESHAYTPHILSDSSGPYICWTVPISSYEDAKEIAARWAEAVEEYRKTGRSF